jgi:hypothetical protein
MNKNCSEAGEAGDELCLIGFNDKHGLVIFSEFFIVR